MGFEISSSQKFKSLFDGNQSCLICFHNDQPSCFVDLAGQPIRARTQSPALQVKPLKKKPRDEAQSLNELIHWCHHTQTQLSLLCVGGGCRRYPTVENRMRLAKAGASGGLPSSSSSSSLDVYAPPPPDTLFASLFMAAITSREKIPHTAKDQPLRNCVLFLQPQHPSNAPTPPRLGPLIFLTRKPQACVFFFSFPSLFLTPHVYVLYCNALCANLCRDKKRVELYTLWHCPKWTLCCSHYLNKLTHRFPLQSMTCTLKTTSSNCR